MLTDREELVIRAKLCESSNRYVDMIDVVKELVKTLPKSENLNLEERNLLAVAYKFEVGARRRSLRELEKLISKPGQNTKKLKILQEFKAKVTKELEALCSDLLSILDSILIPGVDEPESDIFYHKLKGDYCRYLAEVEDNQSRAADLVQTAKENYDGATEYAEKDLPATHPLRIGLAMNYSVFMYEILEETAKAYDHARHFYDEALNELEAVRDVDEARYNECARLLFLMHENLKVWSESDAETLPDTASKGP